MQYWSGNATAAEGMELDAIAAVVLGGTLLSGGIGSVLGTVVGVLILAIIGQIVTLENLTSWWTKHRDRRAAAAVHRDAEAADATRRVRAS